MKLSELHLGDIIVIDYSWFGRPTIHYVVTEVKGERLLCAFHGDINHGDRPRGWLEINDSNIPDGTILVARPNHPYVAFSREYFKKDICDKEPPFEILYVKDEYMAKKLLAKD